MEINFSAKDDCDPFVMKILYFFADKGVVEDELVDHLVECEDCCALVGEFYRGSKRLYELIIK